MAKSTIFRDVREAADGRELSLRWYRSKIKELAPRMTAQGVMGQAPRDKIKPIPTYGMMNLYWYKPLNAARLKYYDLFPLVIPFKKHRNGFTGLNMHYLSMGVRVQLLDRMKVYAEEEKLEVYWDLIGGIRQVRPIVRRYSAAQVQSLFLRIPLEDMLVGVLLPVQEFYKGEWGYKQRVASRSVWYHTRKAINS